MSKLNIIEYNVYYGICKDGERNTQTIKEALMREAVKQCDCYCTDLLIFFENTWKDLIKGEYKEITLYFRQMGIDWKMDIGKVDKYRSKAVLKRNTEKLKDTLELSIEYGNV